MHCRASAETKKISRTLIYNKLYQLQRFMAQPFLRLVPGIHTEQNRSKTELILFVVCVFQDINFFVRGHASQNVS